jgi:hypothetical protein
MKVMTKRVMEECMRLLAQHGLLLRLERHRRIEKERRGLIVRKR